MNGNKVHQVKLTVSSKLLQIGFMLEEVGVNFLVVQAEVRLDVIRKFNNLEIDAILGKERFDLI